MGTTKQELDSIKLGIELAVAEHEPTIVLTVEDAKWLVEMAENVLGYYELLYAVEQAYPGESRHQTALRYIRERESRQHDARQPAKSAATVLESLDTDTATEHRAALSDMSQRLKQSLKTDMELQERALRETGIGE